jgi:hypothetical protein
MALPGGGVDEERLREAYHVLRAALEASAFSVDRPASLELTQPVLQGACMHECVQASWVHHVLPRLALG